MFMLVEAKPDLAFDRSIKLSKCHWIIMALPSEMDEERVCESKFMRAVDMTVGGHTALQPVTRDRRASTDMARCKRSGFQANTDARCPPGHGIFQSL